MILALAAAAALAAGAAQPAAPAARAPELRVVKLPSATAQLRSSDQVVTLLAGSRAFSIPPDAVTTVLSGELWALLVDVLIKARAGDAFIFHAADGHARLFVTAGAVEIVRPDGSRAALTPGEHEEFGPPAAKTDSRKAGLP